MVILDGELVTERDLTSLQWPFLRDLGVEAAVTGRHGGVSGGPYRSLNLGLHVGDDIAAVIENRRRAARLVSADLDDLVFATQVHGATALTVTAAHRGRGTRDQDTAVGQADILITTEGGPVLVILVADCVPVLLVDPERSVMGLIHAGWRGTAQGAVGHALAAMSDRGARPDRIHACIGPAVAASRYQVGDDVAGALRPARHDANSSTPWPGAIEPDGRAHWLVDLPRANAELLAEAGVPLEQIHGSTYCTGPNGPFFSDREARPCGRFGLLARLSP
jgi:polyphenol oxidase